MNVGVLTSEGEMYLFVFRKKMQASRLEEWISDEIGISSENFNWQVLGVANGDNFLPFRIVEVM